MSEGAVLALQEAARAKAPRVVVEAEDLRARQGRIAFEDCHAAFERVTLETRTKTARIPVFHDLSLGFPRGRKVTVLGHEASGREKVLDLLLRKASPTRGRVHINSRLSFYVGSLQFVEHLLSTRDNALYVSHVVGVDPKLFLAAVSEFCEIEQKAMHDQMRNLPVWMRRRFALVCLLACDFDCYLLDSPFRANNLNMKGQKGEAIEEMIFGRDYIASVGGPGAIHASCDLVYIVYEGRIFAFDNVAEARRVYNALPEPTHTLSRSAGEDVGLGEPASPQELL